ncbi:hypothetical protein N7471_000258 [Penicillium samsonianum]|uniref:uncharacterized protein n=1 Tax=Penicillium samsonianum TaxID=1882272 RepID=UPI002546E9D6|nr:uncharacterized protein N7471_000258 [Penicillium samsonianum]KAJ6149059.1 hypothetical protein N7471_000258 [Penicillium samsonianum]
MREQYCDVYKTWNVGFLQAGVDLIHPAPTTLPTWRTYPPYVVEPVNEEDGDDDDDDDNDDDDDDDGAGGIITSCKLWFFNICLGGRFKSIRWTLPPGIYPPVGRDNKLTYSDEPSCQTESAKLCSTTVLKSETLVGTITSTVTATSAACETVYDCSLTDWESTTTTKAPICEPTSSSGGEYQPPAAGCPAPAIVYPKDPENPDVEYAYYYEESNYNTGFPFEVEDTPQDWNLPLPLSHRTSCERNLTP